MHLLNSLTELGEVQNEAVACHPEHTLPLPSTVRPWLPPIELLRVKQEINLWVLAGAKHLGCLRSE
jgi:hypothetical protein